MEWTKEQQKVIDFRGGNLLVSAAAGSGKTAVMIERIIKKVLDEKEHTGIDDIVVVTFTKAAAEEMKTRLSRAFEKELSANPDNRYLIRQISLVDSARICTIDSFCSYIVRNYYNAIGIDPSFRIADEGELNLMRADVMSDIIERHFADNDGAFEDFVEAFAGGKKLDRIYDIIIGLHRFAQSNPWPSEWINKCLRDYLVDEDEYENLPVVKDTIGYIKASLAECVQEYEEILDECSQPGGPNKYSPVIEEERERLQKAMEGNTLEELETALDIKYSRLPADKNTSEDARTYVKNIRDGIKKRIAALKDNYLTDIHRQYGDMAQCSHYVRTITSLTSEFTDAYQKAKAASNIVDFPDIEHYALDILVKRTDEGYEYTEIADELAAQYKEIYIDEYQDSNLVQELILKAVSRERFGNPDMFMVGDVKQSIYKFRMANPGLFIEKYNSYGKEGSYVCMELHKNFRSRENVINSVNDVFYMAMKEEIGGIGYSREAALNYGLNAESEADDTTDIYIADKDGFEGVETSDIYYNMAVNVVNRLMSENSNLRYRDIVILLRSDKKDAPGYAAALNAHNIPCVYSKTTGYFDSYEVSKVLDLLRVIDNPRQEIPLAGVMRSFFAAFTTEELAVIKGRKRRTQLYDCVTLYAGREDDTAARCRNLLDLIEHYRKISRVATINELISDIIYDSGYYEYAGTMTGGKLRKANLEMLVQKAREFEKTSYSGLFNFLRYIEKLRKYEVDYGEAQSESEEDDVVRIMSIHKSKGLEFPVVILGNSAKEYNLDDTKNDIIYDSEFGIGISDVDLKYRIKYDTAYRRMLSRRMKADDIGEELRILYVAMTRAVDKLIVLGVTSCDKRMEVWKRCSSSGRMGINYIMENRSYLDIIMPLAINSGSIGKFDVHVIDRDELSHTAVAPLIDRSVEIKRMITGLSDIANDGKDYEMMCKALDYVYPHNNVYSLRAKYSVSELKHKAMEESELLEAQITPPEKIKPVPEFIEKTENDGISRGNAYHKVFELLDYDHAQDIDAIRRQLDGWIDEGRISVEYAGLVNLRKYTDFLETDLGKRMKKAYDDNKLYREQPFTMEVSSSEIDPSYPEDEKVLIQGIIDAFFFENDKVYIVDYKTDRVSSDIVLTERYGRQLSLYSEALSRITGRECGGCYIYSVHLNRAVII